MGNKNDKLSIFISLILRHRPDVINITLDKHGYADVNELINGINYSGRSITLEVLKEIVQTDKKGRYSFNSDYTKIRANQGHSINVDVELLECVPPKYLYHGTSRECLDSILKKGIKKINRLYVHLSDNKDTAIQVGRRHGKPVVLKVSAKQMFLNGYKFYISENKIWLTDFVPSKYIDIMEDINK